MDDNMDIFSSTPDDESNGENAFEDISSSSVEEKNDSFDLNSFSSGAQDNERKKRNKKKQGKQRVLKMILTVMLVGIITVSIVVGSFLLYAFTMVDGTVEDNLNDLELNFTTAIYVVDEESGEWVEYQRLHGEYNRIWKAYNEKEATAKDNADYKGIPQTLVNAFIAVEDKRFNTHYGVDWKRTFGAVVNTIIPIYSSRQGGSTITQQLVKNLTDDRDQNAMRKVREIMRARYLESHYSKETIIECYLNTIPMGHGLYGVEVAANYYFNKSVKELTLLECASLASITKAPSNYAPDDNPKNNKARRETVLALMLEEGYITQAEHDAALKEELNLVASREHLNETEVNNYFVDALIVEVTKDLAAKYGWEQADAIKNFYDGGYKIYTTLDPDIQAAVDEVYSDSEKYGIKAEDGSQLQGAITVMDYKGRIKGLAGSIGEKTANLGLSGFNRATDAVRQPGSTMKPLSAYSLAIENNLHHYSSIVNDTKIYYNVGSKEPWTPPNWYSNGYMGAVTIERALEKSINTIPVAIVDKLGKETSYNFLTQKLGITTLTEQDMNLSPLGMGGTNGGITTKESAAAYAIFGNGGQYYKPTTYYAVYDQHNDLVLSNEKLNPVVAVSENTATIMNKLLQRVVYGSGATGVGAANTIPNMKIYAKTGTTNRGAETIDLWFAGGSPYYVASAWCGYDTPQHISTAHKAIAQQMWSAVMSKIHEGLAPKEFEVSNYAIDRYFCTETGQLATTGCPSKSIGWYKKNYKPSVCSTHEGTALESPEIEAQKAEEALKQQELQNAQNGQATTSDASQTTSTPTTSQATTDATVSSQASTTSSVPQTTVSSAPQSTVASTAQTTVSTAG